MWRARIMRLDMPNHADIIGAESVRAAVAMAAMLKAKLKHAGMEEDMLWDADNE
jgi:hypothetical protein